MHVFVLFSHFLYPNVPDNKSHKEKWHVLLSTCIKLSGACTGMCTLRVKFPKKSSFSSNEQFFPDCGPKFYNFLYQDPHLKD